MLRQSSLEANESVKPFKVNHYEIIRQTLIKSKTPLTSYQISDNCELTYAQVHKRLSEMESSQTVKVVGRAFDIPNRPLLWITI